MRHQIVSIAVLLIAAIAFASCSLDIPHSKNTGTIRILLDPRESQKSQDLFELLSTSSPAVPTSISDFNCFTVNVNGAGISAGPLPGAGCSTSDNMQGRGVGIASLPVVRGQSIELSVPAGAGRTIDVYGIFPSTSACAGTEPTVANPAGGYFLGGIVQSLNLDSVVTVAISFITGRAASLTCKGNAPATPPVFTPAPLLGQTDPTSSTAGSGAGGMTTPGGIFSDGTHLVVADTGNNRVLIWNSIPTIAGQSPDLVLGQANFTGTSPNRSGSPSANTVYTPGGIAISGGKLLVADTNNFRVLVWNTFPAVNGQNADVVIGQPDFVTTTPGLSASQIDAPNSIAVSPAGALYVALPSTNQVLYYPSIPTSNGASAQFIIGQTAFGGSSPGTSVNQVSNPNAVAAGSFGVAVIDSNNSRVLIFNTPGSNGSSAIHVLGQPNFTSPSPTCTAVGMNAPNAAFAKGNILYVADTANERVLQWNDITTVSDGQAADHVFGQPDMISCSAGTTQTTLQTPSGVFSDSSNNLFVCDGDNNRVTINSFF